MTRDEQAIRDLIATWMTATKAGDIPTVLSLMTDDAVFMTVGREPFGKDAFSRQAAALKGATIDGKSDVREVKIEGDLAYARSYLTVTMTPAGGRPLRREGWALTVLTRGSDGRWRLARDANLLPPPEG